MFCTKRSNNVLFLYPESLYKTDCGPANLITVAVALKTLNCKNILNPSHRIKNKQENKITNYIGLQF